jgi:hypothetical protein
MLTVNSDDSVNSKCITEALLASYGATVPVLRKVNCVTGTWVARTYYQERPASSYGEL